MLFACASAEVETTFFEDEWFPESAVVDLTDDTLDGVEDLMTKAASDVTLDRGETLQLEIPGKTIKTCESKDKKIATVTKKGLVKGVAEGKVKVVVTTSDKEKTAVTVHVTDLHAPTDIVILEPETRTLLVGDSMKLEVSMTAQVEPVDTTLTWKTSDKKIASVSKDGEVKGLKPGSARITVKTANKLKASLEFTVVDPSTPTSIQIELPEDEEWDAPLYEGWREYSLKAKGKTVALQAVVAALGEPKTKLTWKTSDKKIAKVNKNGVVSAVDTGVATITVTTSNKLSDSILVVVMGGIPSNREYMLWPGDTKKLKLLKDSKKVTYESSDPSRVSVDDKGVTVVSEDCDLGSSVVITAKASDGKIERCRIKTPKPCDSLWPETTISYTLYSGTWEHILLAPVHDDRY